MAFRFTLWHCGIVDAEDGGAGDPQCGSGAAGGAGRREQAEGAAAAAAAAAATVVLGGGTCSDFGLLVFPTDVLSCSSGSLDASSLFSLSFSILSLSSLTKSFLFEQLISFTESLY